MFSRKSRMPKLWGNRGRGFRRTTNPVLVRNLLVQNAVAVIPASVSLTVPTVLDIECLSVDTLFGASGGSNSVKAIKALWMVYDLNIFVGTATNLGAVVYADALYTDNLLPGGGPATAGSAFILANEVVSANVRDDWPQRVHYRRSGWWYAKAGAGGTFQPQSEDKYVAQRVKLNSILEDKALIHRLEVANLTGANLNMSYFVHGVVAYKTVV